MSCYTEWDTYLVKGSQEYDKKKAELEAKLRAVKHIVDYYFKVEGLRVLPAKHSGHQALLEMAHLQFEVDKSNLGGKHKNEENIIKNIAHHCSCDGINFTQIYDLVSLLDIHDNNEAGYARIMMNCANIMRG